MTSSTSSTQRLLSHTPGDTGWLALEPPCVPWHKRFARDTILRANLFRLRRPGRVQSDSTGATLRVWRLCGRPGRGGEGFGRRGTMTCVTSQKFVG